MSHYFRRQTSFLLANLQNNNPTLRTNKYIKDMGYRLIEVKINEDLVLYLPPEGMIGIATGLSPRQTKFEKDRECWNRIQHCVIGKFTQTVEPEGDKERISTQCEFIHDPHPSNEFIKTLEWMSILIPL